MFLWPEDGDGMWNCVAIDPGGTSGWCALSVHELAMYDPEYAILDNINIWSCGEFIGELGEQVDRIIELCDAWPNAEYVFEDFVLRTQVMSREVLDPVRVAEPVKWWLERGYKLLGDDELGPRSIALQLSSLAMTTVTDSRLKAIGMYLPTVGKPHARDALRHALTWARRRKAALSGHDWLAAG